MDGLCGTCTAFLLYKGLKPVIEGGDTEMKPFEKRSDKLKVTDLPALGQEQTLSLWRVETKAEGSSCRMMVADVTPVFWINGLRYWFQELRRASCGEESR